MDVMTSITPVLHRIGLPIRERSRKEKDIDIIRSIDHFKFLYAIDIKSMGPPMDLIFKGPLGTLLQLKDADGTTIIATLLIVWGGIIAIALILK